MTASWTPHPVLVAGPCALEGGDVDLRIADYLGGLSRRLGVRVLYKGSFDKANRSGADAPRGIGLERGLEALARVRDATGLPILTDVHESHQVPGVSEVVDALQIPAFLCRQTDLLEAAGRAGIPVNIKKGQWCPPTVMGGAVAKVRRGGGKMMAVTERGTFFGYGDLVVDFRSFRRLRDATGASVLFDATHAVQRPGQGRGGASGGSREDIPALLFGAAAAGADGFYLETHPDPARAPSDADSMIPLPALAALVEKALDLWERVHEHAVVPT